jgi:hypothetical protein
MTFSPGKTPPAIQQMLHAEREQQIADYVAEFKKIPKPQPSTKPADYKPTALVSVSSGIQCTLLQVDPRYPPPEFPYQEYLMMKQAQAARDRRLREREKQCKQGLVTRLNSTTSSEWPMLWIRKIFRSERNTSQGGRRIR